MGAFQYRFESHLVIIYGAELELLSANCIKPKVPKDVIDNEKWQRLGRLRALCVQHSS